jgi:hypothetical protein
VQLTQAKIKLTIGANKQITAPDVLIMKHVATLLKDGDKRMAAVT